MRLVQADGTPVPAGAQAVLGAKTFPVALDGLLYVEGLGDAGSVQVSWVDGSCQMQHRPTARH